MSILIKKPLIVNADGIISSDILIEKGKIMSVAENIHPPEKRTTVIDAERLYALPGGIDPHVHLALPTPAGNSSDDFHSGSIAALSGGTTTIIDFVTPSRDQSLAEAYKQRKKEAKTSLIDYKFHMGISGYNQNTTQEIAYCINKLGITSFKAYLAYRNSIGIDYESLEKVMKQLAGSNALLMIHCEEGDEIIELQNNFIAQGLTSPQYHALSRPNVTESKSVEKVLELVKKTRCTTYLVHISAKRSIEQIAEFKKKAKVFTETCPQYLILDKKNYESPHPDSLKYVISPPLRDKASKSALWNNISNGNIDVIATDHCPFNTNGQKDKGIHDFTKIPNGAGGIEYRMSLLFSYGVLKNKISLQRFVELTSTNAARIFGLYPRKGVIAMGSDADIVLWDPKREKTIRVDSQVQHCDSNIYDGIKITGVPAYVISSGVVAYHYSMLQNKKIRGRLL
jgi:dihydropyrimidinase